MTWTQVFIIAIIWLIIGTIFINNITLFLVDEIKYKNLVLITLISGFLSSILAVLNVVLRAKRKVLELSAFRIVQLLITIFITVYLVAFKEIGVAGVVWGDFIGVLCVTILQHLYFKKLIKIKINFEELKELFSYGFPFFPHRLLTYATAFVAQYLIKEFIGISESGLYNIALRFALPLAFVVTAIQSAWVPIKFQIHREEESNSSNILSNMMNVYFIFISILFVCVLSIGPDILRLMTTSDFHEAAKYLPFVILIPFSRGIFHVMGTGFEITKNTKPMPIVSGLGLLVLLIISILLVDNLGIYAFILAVILSWSTQALVMRYFSIKRFYVSINYKLLSFLILICLFMSFTYFFIQDLEFYNRTRIQICTTIFSLLFILYFTFYYMKNKLNSLYNYNFVLDKFIRFINRF